jgi:hypothetical protein
MGLRKFFRLYDEEQFTEAFGIEMNVLRTQVEGSLRWSVDEFTGETLPVDSLVDLQKHFPRVFIDVFMLEREFPGSVVSRTTALFESPAFQAIWLMDGGNVDSTLSKEMWRRLLSDLCEFGAHGWFYQMPFKDAELALEATSRLIEYVTESPLAQQYMDTEAQSAWNIKTLQSLIGFRKANSFEDASASEIKNLALHYFTAPEASTPLGLSTALEEFVYNEALRLKSRGHPVHQVVNRLGERISAVFDCVTSDSSYQHLGRIYPFFHRQVLINALAPFAGDLAYLDAMPGELYGHPHEKTTPDDKVFFANFKEEGFISALLHVFHGPTHILFSTEPKFAPFNIAMALEEKGIELDLNALLTGSITNRDFLLKAVQYKGYCVELDKLFASFPRLTDKASAHAYRIREYADHTLWTDSYSPDGKIGMMAAFIESGRASILSGKPLKKRPDRFIDRENLQDEALRYLQASGPMDHRLLQWCGFGSDVLTKLTETDQERLAEHFLGEDLGL